MKTEQNLDLTILFADIAGSVELYESLGDVAAHNKIVGSQMTMAKIVEQHKGRVVEVIGDEIMCMFKKPDNALNAACNIQESVYEDVKTQISVRIGFNSGPTGIEDGHPFGDTVNVAARMVAIAKAGQIIMGQQSFSRVSELKKRQTRLFKRMVVKGKHDPLDVYEIVCEDLDYTRQISREQVSSLQRNSISSVNLTFKGKSYKVKDFSKEVTVGRGPQCDIRVRSDMASRLHLLIKSENGIILLKDQSTNGTYIKTRSGNRSADDQDLYLHNEEWLMANSGMISLGVPVAEHEENIITFSCD
jgi:adenylate cyclase